MLPGNDVTFVARDHGRGRIRREINALSTSGRPRVPVVGAERIIIIQLEIKSFLILRVKCAFGRQQSFDTTLCFGVFTVEIK